LSSNAALIKQVSSLTKQIQQIPAPTFQEKHRAEFILSTWKEQGIKDAWMDETGNVYACLHGDKKRSGIVVSAHLDTVFPAETDLTLKQDGNRIYGPGIGDNSLGLAGLFGLYWSLTMQGTNRRKQPGLQGDIWLVANVGEEGLGDLKGMKAVVDYFGNAPTAYIVLEGMSLGQIYHRGLGVRRYRIIVNTKGGHSWIDYGSPSAIHRLAELVVKINAIPLPKEPRTTINVGTIEGGTSVNTIAPVASCELDLRSEDVNSLNQAIERVLVLVQEAAQKDREGVQVRSEVIGDRPTGEIPTGHQLVELAVNCHIKNGIKPRLNIGSTDANVPLSRGIDAICVGLTTGGGAHTRGEYIDTDPLEQGLVTLVDMIRSIDRNWIDTDN
jgi:tripeptide aminopeptidase